MYVETPLRFVQASGIGRRGREVVSWKIDR